MNTTELNLRSNHNISENEGGLNVESSSEISLNSINVTSFENISFFIATHKYPIGLNLNQKRTLRKAATNFSLIGKLSFGVLNSIKILFKIIYCF
jgi:hypothetical protein